MSVLGWLGSTEGRSQQADRRSRGCSDSCILDSEFRILIPPGVREPVSWGWLLPGSGRAWLDFRERFGILIARVVFPPAVDKRAAAWFRPTGVVIPSEGVLAGVEESRLRDPSAHFVRSG